MRRKRLNHVAFTLCHMFCGWQLYPDYRALEKLGDGTLHIDLETLACTFNGRKISSLSIARTLRAFFDDELTVHKIPITAIESATLKVELKIEKLSAAQRPLPKTVFPVTAKRFTQCHFACQSRIVTSSAVYAREFSKVDEWPAY
jgi:hypothetical protein